MSGPSQRDTVILGLRELLEAVGTDFAFSRLSRAVHYLEGLPQLADTAPELADALEAILDDGLNAIMPEQRHAARAALAKAGREVGR